MQLFSGSTNLPLARKITGILDIPLGITQITEFPNRETRVWVTEERIHKDVAVVQSFSGDPNKAIVEFCLLVDALRRSGAKTITAVVPWMGYSIQDKIFRQGEPLSSRVVADIIQSVRPDRIITVDLHNEAIQGFFSVPFTHLTAVPLFLERFKKLTIDCVVAPDVGALKETTKIASQLGLPIVILNKQRDLHTGEVRIIGSKGDIEGKTALIMDDFISTGGTIIQAADFLKTQGVQKVIMGASHHLFVAGVQEKLAKSALDELYITDTVAMPEADKAFHGQLPTHVVSVAELIAQELKD